MDTAALTMGPRQWAMLLLLALLWGGSFFAIEIALTAFGPLAIAAARVALAAPVLWAAYRALVPAGPREPALWRDLLIMGALNNALPFALIAWGQTRITGSLAAILVATTPLFTVVLAGALTSDERWSARRLAGVALGVAGVVVMVGPGALRGLGGEALAQLAVLTAAFSYAVAVVFGKRFRGRPPLLVAMGQTFAATALLVPLALVVEGPWHWVPAPGPLLAVLGLGVVSTAFAYLLYFRILADAGATNLSLVTLLIPVSAIVLGSLFLDESLSGAQLLGMILISAGLVSIDGRLLGWLRGQISGGEMRGHRGKIRGHDTK